MSERQQQSDFVRALGKLIAHAYDVLGCELTFGDGRCVPCPKCGYFAHKPNGFHPRGLAQDINLFKDGLYLKDTNDHAVLGAYWESLGGSWGGHWNDGNHYSWGERSSKPKGE